MLNPHAKDARSRDELRCALRNRRGCARRQSPPPTASRAALVDKLLTHGIDDPSLLTAAAAAPKEMLKDLTRTRTAMRQALSGPLPRAEVSDEEGEEGLPPHSPSSAS